jgi:hypothetical protein
VSPIARPEIGLWKVEGLSSVSVPLPLANVTAGPFTALENSALAPFPMLIDPVPVTAPPKIA